MHRYKPWRCLPTAFTCGKNSLAATRISRALAQQGIATLRFDFTGLGEAKATSGAVAFVQRGGHCGGGALDAEHDRHACTVGRTQPGGTAAIAAAARLDGIRAVCTLGAPATADHVLRHFGPTKSEEDGQIQNRFPLQTNVL